MKKRVWGWIVLALCGAFSSENTVNGLESLLQQLAGATLPIRQAELARNEQHARIESFKGGAFPQVSFSTGLTYADNSTKALLSGFPMAGGADTPSRMRGLNYQWSLQLVQTMNVARIGLVLQMAQTQAQTIALQHRLQKDQIFVQGISLYAQALMSAKELKLAQSKQRRLQEALRFLETEARFGSASGKQLKLMRAEAVLANIAVLQLENQLANQKTDLMRMLP
jgi:outer membrane protein TolC